MSSLVQSMAVPVTEDTPADLLAGSMDLRVLLPGGSSTKTSVQRATPMMDLLVQLCTAHRLSPGGHSLQPLGDKGALPYKPSTPIGLLDAWSVRLLPKGAAAAPAPAAAPAEHPHRLPFQHTFRLQVHLPRNQLLVSRVTPQMGLAAVLRMACGEKNLDPAKYELRHPINLEERLRPELTLGDYGLTEVCVMARDSSGAGPDALALQREQERRRRRAKQQHGAHVAAPAPATATATATARQPGPAGSAVAGSVSSGSLAGSGSGRSSSPDSAPAVPPPRAPARKRRPAPLPPPPATDAEACNRREPAVVITEAGRRQAVSHPDGTTPTVTHSRTSSDSSGYHEASVLSDGPDTHPGDKTISTREMPPPTGNSTLPRRSKLPPATGTTSAALPKRTGPTVANSMPLSRSVSNLASAAPSRAVHSEHSISTSSLSSTGRGPRKKKAAPPPPPVAVPRAGSSAAPAPPPPETRARDAAAEIRAPPRSAASAGNSDARRAAGSQEEGEGVPGPERRTNHEDVLKHHQQQQRSSTELPAEKADLYAKLQRRLPSRGDSLTSTSSSGSDDTAAATAVRGPTEDKCTSVPAPVMRPSRNRDRASAAADRADGQLRLQPDVVAVQVPPHLLAPGSVSSKHSSTAPDEDDLAVDEGIGNDDAAEEVARAFASAAAELEAAILAEDLAAAAAENPAAEYCNIDPPCPTRLTPADIPPKLPPLPDDEDWHYEIPAPPSAFRDSVETPPPVPWSYAEGEVHTRANPLYESGEFVADSFAPKEVSERPAEHTEERNCNQTSGGGETVVEDVVEEEEVPAPTSAERQLQGVLDAKARLLLPQPQLIREADADVDAAPKDADDEPAEGSPSDVLDVPDDSAVSQENHSHSLLNHHHAGLLHRHAAGEHRHDRHHLQHDDDHHHGGHSANVGMPAYLTETIDTLEGFEDLIAVGSGSRPPEEHRNEENGSAGGAELQVADGMRRNPSDSERPVVVGEVVKRSESNITLETSPVNAEVVKEVRRNSTSTVETPIESKGSSASSGDRAVEFGEVFPERRPSGEVTVDERKGESDRRQRAQRRRTVEVAAPLVNFTITTYRREIDPDKIFAEAEDMAASRVSAVSAPSPVAAGSSGERRPSAVSRSNSMGGTGSGCSSSAGSSRRGSQVEQQPGRPHGQAVKRTASSVQGVEVRLTGAVESSNKDSGSSQLQSLQVLRSILPQLESTPDRRTSSSSSSSSEGSGTTADTSAAVLQSERSSRDSQKTTGEARVTEVCVKPQPQPQPYRPPAVSFASWGERPRSRAVSLKVDSDYRVGGAHVKTQQTSQEPQTTNTVAAADISEAATVDGAMPEKQPEPATAVPGGQNAPVGSGAPAPAPAPALAPAQPAAAKVEPTVIRISTATAEPRIRAVQLKAHPPPSGVQLQRSDPATARRDGAALTMRIISHTTAAPFVRRGTSSVTVNGDERVVPVVRAVELKKSAPQQERQAEGDGRADGAGEEVRFVGVSSLAERFSFLGDDTVVQRRNSGGSRVSRRPVSELVAAVDVTEPGGAVHRAGSFTSLVSASRAGQLGRSDSCDDSGIVGHSAGVSSQNGHASPMAKRAPVTVSAAPKGFPLPVVKGFRVPGGGAPEPRKGITLVANTRPKAAATSSVPVATANPHEQLMAAIRGFGGTGNLRNQVQKIAECES